MTYRDAVREFKRQLLWEALIRNRGNQCRTGRELDLHRNVLRYKMRDLGIDAAEVKEAARIVAEEVRA